MVDVDLVQDWIECQLKSVHGYQAARSVDIFVVCMCSLFNSILAWATSEFSNE